MQTSGGTISLRARIIRAGAWTLGGHVAGQFLRLSSNLIMTRLLVPEMFGLMALANVILIGLHMFSDLGLNLSVVQSRRGGETAYLNTVWTLQILRGALIWVIALLVALVIHLLGTLHLLPAGSAYTSPVLPYVIAALSFNALIGGLASTRLATAGRNLALGRITLIELVSQAFGLALMIGWALVDRSIWALAAGSLLSSLTRVAMSHTILPGEKNALHWDQEAFREIFRFGKWVFLTSTLGFLGMNGDRLILGGLIDPATLGFYAIAFFMVNALQEVLTKLFSNVAFPSLSEVARERPGDLKQTYYKFRRPLDAVALLAMGFLLTSGHLLIRFLYDDRYLAAGPMIEILCISLFEVRYWLAGQCFLALGKPNLLVPITLARVAALFVFMPVMFGFAGLNGALWVAACSAFFSLPFTFYFKHKLGILNMGREISAFPFLLAGILFGSVVNGLFSP